MTISFESALKKSAADYIKKKILVAFSGGVDSCVLLHWLSKNGFNVVACHINHSIRGENADRDELFCKNFCLENNVEFVSRSVDAPGYVKIRKTSLEEAARILRYKALLEVMQSENCDILFTAHHLNDLVETFFLKVLQGSAIYNLKGFSNDCCIFRPMLFICKSDILVYAGEKNISFVEDETNSCESYMRNWVRIKIIPEIEKYNRSFMTNVVDLQNQSESLKNHMLSKTGGKFFVEKTVHFEGDFSKLMSLDDFEKRFVLSEFLHSYFRMESRHIQECLKVIHNKSNSCRINLPGGFVFEKSYGKLFFYEKKILKPFQSIKKNEEKSVEVDFLGKKLYFDDTLAERTLIVRNRAPGDRFKGKKLKDIFIDKKIELFIRDTSLLVEHEKDIIWVEHLSSEFGVRVEYAEK